MKQTILVVASMVTLAIATCNEKIDFSKTYKVKVTNLFGAYPPASLDSVSCYSSYIHHGGVHHEVLLHLNARMVFVIQPGHPNTQGIPFIKMYVDADKQYSFSQEISSIQWSTYGQYRAIELRSYNGTVDHIVEMPGSTLESLYKKLISWRRQINKMK